MSHVNLIEDFHKARSRAELEQVLARLRGKPIDLLDYEDVRRKLHAEATSRKVLKEVPIAAIVGSVGRSGDFTRGFLPKQEQDAERWARVKGQILELEGLPPVEMYQIGDAYFVLDGNHRVSVARELGATHIEAYVIEVQSRVPLTPDADPAEVLAKARYVDFLERTELDQLRPETDLSAGSPAAYDQLERHIDLHRYVMGLERGAPVSYPEAVAGWHDDIYAPVAQVIRDLNALAEFPGSTVTDLYLLVSDYRALTEAVWEWAFDDSGTGGEAGAGVGPAARATGATQDEPMPPPDVGGPLAIPPEVGSRLADPAAVDKAGPVSGQAGAAPRAAPGDQEVGQLALPLRRLVARVLGRAREAGQVLPGEWRRDQLFTRQQALAAPDFRLFASILVPFNESPSAWSALDQALEIARLERGRLLGLYVVPDADAFGPGAEPLHPPSPGPLSPGLGPLRPASFRAGSPPAAPGALAEEFARRCQAAGILGRLATTAGEIAPAICERSRWVDITVAGLSYPPPAQRWLRLSSGFRSLVRNCDSPLLAIPAHGFRSFERAIVAYNGSPKSEEALFVAAYVSRRWRVALTVVSVAESGFEPEKALREAETFLRGQGVDPGLEETHGPFPAAVVGAARDRDASLIVMGGYGRRGMAEVLLASSVDEVLRTAGMPVLVCP